MEIKCEHCYCMTGEFVDVDTSSWTATPPRRSAPMGSEAVPDPALKGWKLPLNFERDSTTEDRLAKLHWDDECEWGGCQYCTLRRGGSGSGYIGPNAYDIPPVNPRVEPVIQKQWDRFEEVVAKDKEDLVEEIKVGISAARDRHSFNDPETRDYDRPDISVKDDGYTKYMYSKRVASTKIECPSCHEDMAECGCG